MMRRLDWRWRRALALWCLAVICFASSLKQYPHCWGLEAELPITMPLDHSLLFLSIHDDYPPVGAIVVTNESGELCGVYLLDAEGALLDQQQNDLRFAKATLLK